MRRRVDGMETVKGRAVEERKRKVRGVRETGMQQEKERRAVEG